GQPPGPDGRPHRDHRGGGDRLAGAQGVPAGRRGRRDHRDPGGRPMSDLTLVTGANGLVGAAVVRALLQRGMPVRAMVVGAAPPGQLADEDTPWDLFDPAVPYMVSKLVQEHEAWRWAARGLDVVCVNPSGPIGWGDAKPTPTGQLVLSVLKGMLPAAPRS